MAPKKGERTHAVDWFSEHIPAWSRHLKGGGPRDRVLMVGAYEGLSLAWLFENVIRPDVGSATVVDSFRGYDDCVYFRGEPVYNPRARVKRAFLHNTEAYKARIRLMSAGTDADADADAALALKRLATDRKAAASPFDLVVITCKSSTHALEMCVLAFPLLAPGGTMILENYTFNKEHDSTCPRRGIDAFVDAYAHRVRAVSAGFHYFVERRREPLRPAAPCHSEFYEEPAQLRPVCRKGGGGGGRKKNV
jgi:hypothetical protein